MLICFYCRKRAVRRGVCKTKSVGEIDVCGRHFKRIEVPNKNLGRGLVPE